MQSLCTRAGRYARIVMHQANRYARIVMQSLCIMRIVMQGVSHACMHNDSSLSGELEGPAAEGV
jgi:hypothetical protein